MALSPFWYGALVALAAWQFVQIPLAVLFYGKTTTIDGIDIASSLILGLAFLTIAFALSAGVL